MSCESQWAWHGTARRSTRCSRVTNQSPDALSDTRFERYIYKTMRGNKCLSFVVQLMRNESGTVLSTIFVCFAIFPSPACPFLQFYFYLGCSATVDCVFRRWLAANAQVTDIDREKECLIWAMRSWSGHWELQQSSLLLLLLLFAQTKYIVLRSQQIKGVAKDTTDDNDTVKRGVKK